MTKFDRSKFNMGMGRERYVTYEGRFVGRFKHTRPGHCAAHFVYFLVENFTVEEYFARLDAGVPPLRILEERGYIDYHTGRAMKHGGFATKAELLTSMMERSLAGRVMRARATPLGSNQISFA